MRPRTVSVDLTTRTDSTQKDLPAGVARRTEDASGAGDADAPGPEAEELRAVAEEIARSFPSAPERTALMLYEVDPHHLQAQWQIAQDDLAKGRSAFPAHGGDAEVCLRLLRLTVNDGTREEVRIRRKASASGRQGEVVFGIEGGSDLFQAELGLASADGGWLLLARSSQVRPPTPATERGAAEGHGVRVSKDSDRHGIARGAGVVDQRASSSEAVGTKVEPALAAVGVPLHPEFPLPRAFLDPAPRNSPVGSSGMDPESDKPGPSPRRDNTPPLNPQQAAPPIGIAAAGEWATLAPPLLPSGRGMQPDGWSSAMTFYDPRSAVSSREFSAPAVLHAELLVWGIAAPGSLLKIFGHEVPVGKDGRFSLRHPVDASSSHDIARVRSDGPSSESDEG
jgi:hypothetical protein